MSSTFLSDVDSALAVDWCEGSARIGSTRDCIRTRATRSASRRMVSPVIAMSLGEAIVLAAPPGATAESPPDPPARLARQPDIHGDLIAFVHGEDIWTVPSAGGVAKRITFHEGEERFPRFSNDGRRIAFTGEYDGNADVYVMNVEGGEISRVTHHPGSDEVVGWHPTNGKILFRSTRDSYSRFTRLYLIAPDGSGLEGLPLPEAGWGSFSADGTDRKSVV